MLGKGSKGKSLRSARYSPEFIKAFEGHLQQIFLYITNRCGLRCEQCFYKDQLGNQDMLLDVALYHIEQCAHMGATKLTLLGGEPSLYDYGNGWHDLRQLLLATSSFGYKAVRLDTNGQFEPSFLDVIDSIPTTEISFSLDGLTSIENDRLRGAGTFDNTIENIAKAVRKFDVSVTICVSQHNVKTLEECVLNLSRVGVTRFNFHPLLKVGNSQDRYIDGNHITPEQWLSAYEMLAGVAGRNPAFSMRIPPRFSAIGAHVDGQKYCSIRLRDRLHIQPDGEVRVCPLHVGTSCLTARPQRGAISLMPHSTELDLGEHNSICPAQTMSDRLGQPLCVSYKPSATVFGRADHE